MLLNPEIRQDPVSINGRIMAVKSPTKSSSNPATEQIVGFVGGPIITLKDLPNSSSGSINNFIANSCLPRTVISIVIQ